MAETKEKTKKKKKCTEEHLYRKKYKASGHASRERDINNTKLHTLSGNF